MYVESWDTNFPSLKQNEADLLEVPFSKEEIQLELIGANGKKAPAPDSFPFKVTQQFWSDLKEEVFFMFGHFFEIVEFDHRFSPHSSLWF